MSQETLNSFIAKVQTDRGLQEQMKVAADAEAVMGIAKTAGFDITAADLIRLQANAIAELSDEALEGVAGGALPWGKILGGTVLLLTAAAGGTYGYVKLYSSDTYKESGMGGTGCPGI